MEHKSSIHFSPIKDNSESHNYRKSKLDYVDEKLSVNNWHSEPMLFPKDGIKTGSVKEWRAYAEWNKKDKTGRKLQKNAKIMREAVVNIKSTTTPADMNKLANELYKRHKIVITGMHIHRDEGQSLKQKDPKTGKAKRKINHHAHLTALWQDIKTGKTLRFDRKGMSSIQDTVCEVLNMVRGKKVSEYGFKQRLSAIEYKVQQEEEKHQQLQTEILEMEKTRQLVKLDIDEKERLRWLESIISKQSKESFKYATEVLKAPFKEGEKAIQADMSVNLKYAQFLEEEKKRNRRQNKGQNRGPKI